MPRWVVMMVLCPGILAGCDCGDDDDVTLDASVDASLDASLDAAPDAEADAAVDPCCPEGGVCCLAADNGYLEDVCVPEGEACPAPCETDPCAPDEWCVEAFETEPFHCTTECFEEQQCGRICCPTGTRCTGEDCLLPDLTIDSTYMTESMQLTVGHFEEDACEMVEGCIGAPGDWSLLRFGLRTPNIGAGDLHFGVADLNPLFEYSACHRHNHFNGYAQYRLLDADGNEVAPGLKRAFCLEDYERISEDAPRAVYNCFYQGIQAGWADTYVAGLDCQWIDVTGVPAGEYTLEASVNFEHLIAESDYENNVARVPVTLTTISCPAGCVPEDVDCCQEGDPCGWAANGSCDCYDQFGWDGTDCGSCTLRSAGCPTVGSCPYGCPDFEPACCVDGNPCGYEEDGYCDCGGTQEWDSVDCGHCLAEDPECPVPL